MPRILLTGIFYRMLLAFGFSSTAGLPFPGETKGILQNFRNWSGRTKPTITMGLEISVSAIQVANAATVFANDGTLLKPHIVKKIVSPEGRLITEFKREPVRNVISPENARTMLVMMEKATEAGGTAWRALPNGVRMSSKTGTAQIPDLATQKYSEDRFVASTISLFPSEDPEIITYLVIENPKTSSIFGSRIGSAYQGNCRTDYKLQRNCTFNGYHDYSLRYCDNSQKKDRHRVWFRI